MPRRLWRACEGGFAVYHLLRIGWREPIGLVKVRFSIACEALMTPESLHNLLSLALGFAVAGLFSSAYQLATDRLPTFELLSSGPGAQALAAVLLMVAAPFLIMRNTLLGRRQEGRRFQFVFLATLIAGFWSLMSGLVLVQVA